MTYQLRLSLTIACSAFVGLVAKADDWPRFRGLAGSGVAADSSELPKTWSPEANLAWKSPLPGPGASSPIIVGQKVFVTCYSGYGLSQEEPGDIENLKRHLVCFDLKTGKKLWQQDVKAALPEDPYSGIGVTAHGYASHTPVSDGTNVYAFLGKSGVHAFTMEGQPLWQAKVGIESDPAKWGSSSSPIVYKDTVIVTASAESQAIVGIDKESGKELWRQEAKGLDGMWGTPTLVKVDEERTDVVMCVARELWGLDPETGKLRWYADATGAEQAYSSIVVDGSRVYAVTGRGGGSIALDVGGSGDISDSNTAWTGSENASFASPVLYDSKLYVVSRGVLTVIDAESGDRLEQIRLRGAKQTGGRFGSLDYPSPVVVGDRLYALNGSGQMYVFQLGDETQQLALNEVTADKELFWGSPAVSNGQMVLRSSAFLYCIADRGDTVQQDANVIAQVDTPPERTAGGQQAGRPQNGRGGGSRQFDPMSMFRQMDTNQDGKIAMTELEGNRMADRLKTLDKDSDDSISEEEFRTGITTLFSRGGGGARGSGGARGGAGGGGNYGNRGSDNRPERPQRPESADN